MTRRRKKIRSRGETIWDELMAFIRARPGIHCIKMGKIKWKQNCSRFNKNKSAGAGGLFITFPELYR